VVSLTETPEHEIMITQCSLLRMGYVAAPRTQLLIHHDPAVDNSETVQLSVNDGQVCLSTTASRTKTTLFLLGLYNDNDKAGPVDLHHQCVPLLNTFGKYNVIYENKDLAESQNIEIDVAAA
jgi:hypothetical protein